MTQKEKAKELVDKFMSVPYEDEQWYIRKMEAKQCALIAVDEIEKSTTYLGYYAGNKFVLYWDPVLLESV